MVAVSALKPLPLSVAAAVDLSAGKTMVTLPFLSVRAWLPAALDEHVGNRRAADFVHHRERHLPSGRLEIQRDRALLFEDRHQHRRRHALVILLAHVELVAADANFGDGLALVVGLEGLARQTHRCFAHRLFGLRVGNRHCVRLPPHQPSELVTRPRHRRPG